MTSNLVILQRTANKCTKKKNARAGLAERAKSLVFALYIYKLVNSSFAVNVVVGYKVPIIQEGDCTPMH